MAITRLDCSFFACEGKGAEAASSVAVNPQNIPGSLVVAGSCVVRDSIGSQVAARLALEHFVEGVNQYFAQRTLREQAMRQGEPIVHPVTPTESGLELLEIAFRNANSSVYEFGHKLAAGGRMAASLISLVVLDGMISCGRVGRGTAWLSRHDELYSFFEAPAKSPEGVGMESGVGANSMVSVELASVPIAPLDKVLVFSSPLDALQEKELASILREVDTGFDVEGLPTVSRNGTMSNPCREVVLRLFPEEERPDFALFVVAGPDTIYLSSIADDSEMVDLSAQNDEVS